MLAVIHHLRSSRLPCPVALLTARPRRAARCRFQRFVTVRNSTRRARRTTEGGETCAFADAKRVRPPGATQSSFARPKPDRGAGLAGSRARAGERPGTAETGERPTSRSAVRTPYREERALHERRCQTPRFPPSATLSSADKSFRRNLELCRFAHCARVSFRLFARRPLRLPGRLQLRQRRQSRELRIRRGGAKVPAPAGSPALGLRRDQGDDVVGPGWGGAPRPFAFAGRRAGTGGHRRTRRFAGEGNTRNRPPKRRVPEDRNADSQRPVDEGRLKVIGEIYRLATGQMELIG